MLSVFKHVRKAEAIRQSVAPFGTIGPKRIRNFFEVDPIFPDFHNKDTYVPPPRLPFGRLEIDHLDQKEKVGKTLADNAKKAIESRKKRQLSRKLKEKLGQDSSVTKTEEGSKDAMMRDLAEQILVDPDVKLPYNFGYDRYIYALKQTEAKADNDPFINDLNGLFQQLSYSNDLELVRMQKQVLVEKSKDNFKDKARAVLLDHVINKIRSIRAGHETSNGEFESYFTDKGYVQSMSEGAIDKDFVAKTEKALSPEALDQEARRLADQAIETKIVANRERRVREKREDGMPAQYKVEDPLYGNEGYTSEEEEFNRWERPLHQALFQPDDPATYYMNIDEYREHLLEKTRRKHYFRERNKYLTNLGHKNSAEEGEARENDADIEPLIKEALDVDKELRDLQRKTGFQDLTEAPTFEEALLEAERILSNAPLSLKGKLDISETEFSPSFAQHKFEPQDLFWGSLSKVILPTVPKAFIKPEEINKKKIITAVDGIENKDEEGQDAALYNAVFREVKQEQSANLGLEDGLRLMVKEPRESNLFDQQNDGGEFNEKMDDETSLKNLTKAEQLELEVFKKVRRDPFYQHHIANELSYYLDRNAEALAEYSRSGALGAKDSRDKIEFEGYELSAKNAFERAEELLKPKLYDGTAYGKGVRKTCSALAVIRPGSGEITVNRRNFIDYFVTQYYRWPVVAPLYYTDLLTTVDVKIFIWGGGPNAQSQAAQLAVSRALNNYNPNNRKLLKPLGYLRVDHRQVEPKHTGKYKARAKFPYSRR